jgi:dephospho-CoA kinase
MKVIGLTGGIGSGKSTVARVFETLGVPVFDADKEAKALYSTDKTLLSELVTIFGKEILDDNGELDKNALARIVFANESALQKVNALVHPRVANRFEQWKSKQNAAFVVREAAILFESGSYQDCDAVIVVTAPEELRISRVMKRSGFSRDEVRNRMARQWPEEELVRRADHQIINDTQTLLLPQIMDIARQLTSRSAS